MANANNESVDKIDHAVDVAIRLALLGFLIYSCFQIVRPFMQLLVWGAIMATAVYPLYLKLLPRLKNKEGLTAASMVVVTLLLLIVPVYELTISFVDTMQTLNARFEAGTLNVPPPNESVQGWPIIGERLFEAWSLASSNIELMVTQYQDELASFSQQAVGVMAGLGGAVGSFIISTIIAGAFLAFAQECYVYAVKVLDRVMNNGGQHFADLGTQTIRSVAQGVIGIAFIQAILSAIGLTIMDVPAVGVWVLLVLVFAVVQLPPIIVLAPIIVYVFSVNDTLPSVIFMIYAIIVSSSDAFLKPLFLGRGMDIPMPVILFGAIGGVILMGILGLFIGAIVLAIGYTLFTNWVNGPIVTINEQAAAESADE
jgi:predicted PurR-regulated permease PerM